MTQPFKKNTLNQDEKYKLVEHLKANLDRCNNKSCEEIAKFCNEDLEFPRKDGKQIKVVAKHVDNQYQILVNNNQKVWTKKETKKTFSIWDLMKKIEKATTQIDNFREFYKTEFGELCKRVSDLESERLTEIHAELDAGDCTEEIAFATNKSKGEALNKLIREDN